MIKAISVFNLPDIQRAGTGSFCGKFNTVHTQVLYRKTNVDEGKGRRVLFSTLKRVL